MKKNILFICVVLASMSLYAFGFIEWNEGVTDKVKAMRAKVVTIDTNATENSNKKVNNDFIYDIGPRFGPIKKSDVDRAISVTDFLSNDQIQRIVSYTSVEVIIIEDDRETDTREFVSGDVLNEAQTSLLRSSGYSTNIKIRADYVETNKETGRVENSYSTPHLTIVPEKQAEYVNGLDALMKYLKENSKEVRANLQANKLQPAKLFFTVTNKGTIEDINLDRTSKNTLLDKTMIELMTTAPGKWIPAENSKGEKVDQVLVVSFGLMGC